MLQVEHILCSVKIRKPLQIQEKPATTTVTGFLSLWWTPRDGTRTPKIIVLRDYVILRIAV